MTPEQFAILTATPDLIGQNLVSDLLSRLDGSGFVPLAALPHQFTTAESVNLYNGRVTHPRRESRLHSSWLSPQLFTAGPSLILLMTSKENHGDPQNRLRQIKGGSRIGEAAQSDLRGLSRLCDRSFSLLHSPDTIEDMKYEAEILFGEGALRKLVACRPSGLDPSVVARIFEPDQPDTNEASIAVLPRTLCRIVALFACDPQAAADIEASQSALNGLDLVLEKMRRLDDCRQLEEVLWSDVERLKKFFFNTAKVEAEQLDIKLPLPPFIRSMRRIELAQIATMACQKKSFNLQVTHALIRAMDAASIPMGTWDAHRLMLTSAYHGGEPN